MIDVFLTLEEAEHALQCTLRRYPHLNPKPEVHKHERNNGTRFVYTVGFKHSRLTFTPGELV